MQFDHPVAHRTRDLAAVTTDSDPPDLPAENDDDDLDEADEGRNANGNVTCLQPILRKITETKIGRTGG